MVCIIPPGWTRADVAVSILQTQVVNIAPPHGTQASLLSKLQHAIVAIHIGDYATAIGDFGAFIHEVNAQTGKKISPSDAATLIANGQAGMRPLCRVGLEEVTLAGRALMFPNAVCSRRRSTVPE
jgi:hypothetical protein